MKVVCGLIKQFVDECKRWAQSNNHELITDSSILRYLSETTKEAPEWGVTRERCETAFRNMLAQEAKQPGHEKIKSTMHNILKNYDTKLYYELLGGSEEQTAGEDSSQTMKRKETIERLNAKRKQFKDMLVKQKVDESVALKMAGNAGDVLLLKRKQMQLFAQSIGKKFEDLHTQWAGDDPTNKIIWQRWYRVCTDHAEWIKKIESEKNNPGFFETIHETLQKRKVCCFFVFCYVF